MANLNQALSGADVKVDVALIEKHLAEMWRTDGTDADDAVTRAALWNVLAHTDNDREKTLASETLTRVSAAIPQRTIVIRAAPAAEPEIHSWISANCHIRGGGKQICSEEITIVAGGEQVHYVPPLVNALLIADMPVAAWWLGDLPSEQENYVITLLDPVDRLIVDSLQFNSIEDVKLLVKVSSGTNTSPADLNWVRIEEWRLATA
ncbi:MAG TPA: glucose-6-phosphate dehydrogenase assembly protein OpcA, partial [Thermoanaerobaculia bacterium]